MPKLQCRLCGAKYWPTEKAVLLHAGTHDPVYKVIRTKQERQERTPIHARD